MVVLVQHIRVWCLREYSITFRTLILISFLETDDNLYQPDFLTGGTLLCLRSSVILSLHTRHYLLSDSTSQSIRVLVLLNVMLIYMLPTSSKEPQDPRFSTRSTPFSDRVYSGDLNIILIRHLHLARQTQ